MLWMYIAMLETAEQKEKITYIYENYADLMYCEALKVVGSITWPKMSCTKPSCT